MPAEIAGYRHRPDVSIVVIGPFTTKGVVGVFDGEPTRVALDLSQDLL